MHTHAAFLSWLFVCVRRQEYNVAHIQQTYGFLHTSSPVCACTVCRGAQSGAHFAVKKHNHTFFFVVVFCTNIVY